MELQYFGANSVQVNGKDFNVVVDPYLYGRSLSRATFKKRPIVLLTQEWDGLQLPDDAFVIDTPGEYEIAGLTIKGVAVRLHVDTDDGPKRGVAYRIIGDSHNFGFLGHVSNNLDNSVLEEFGLLDFLSIPIGGNGYTLDAKGAADIVREIEPKLVVPTHFKDSLISYPVPQNEVEEFAANLGVVADRQDKLKIKNLVTEPGFHVVVLSTTE